MPWHRHVWTVVQGGHGAASAPRSQFLCRTFLNEKNVWATKDTIGRRHCNFTHTPLPQKGRPRFLEPMKAAGPMWSSWGGADRPRHHRSASSLAPIRVPPSNTSTSLASAPLPSQSSPRGSPSSWPPRHVCSVQALQPTPLHATQPAHANGASPSMDTRRGRRRPPRVVWRDAAARGCFRDSSSSTSSSGTGAEGDVSRPRDHGPGVAQGRGPGLAYPRDQARACGRGA